MPMSQSEMEQEIKSLKEEGIALKTQISEMRRSEDRMLNVVLGTLTIVGTIVALLVAFNWWNNYRVYERDKQALHDDLMKTVAERIDTLVKDHNTKMNKRFEDLGKTLEVANKERLDQFRLEMSKDQVGPTELNVRYDPICSISL